MILFRIRELTPVHRRFAEELAACADGRFACVIDERNGPADIAPWPKVSLTVPNCERLGLHCPDDVAWRCGDYGFYLARAQFPQERFFWMVEPDVRFGGAGAAAFFELFRNETEADLLVADLRPADHTYFWEFMITARDLVPFRCIFPVVRLSARAIDYLLAKRIAFARNARRRREWPNDESFVATLLKNHPGMVCRDLNDFGRELYNHDTLSFWKPFDGDALELSRERLTVYHPVLFGAEYRAKVERMEAPQDDRRLVRRVRRRLIRELNKATTWA
ncbi:MAG TPA: hypothetical protein VE690_22370 [Rhodopila sp.]|nr:hypothetical protein [Rhodopila sp.]